MQHARAGPFLALRGVGGYFAKEKLGDGMSLTWAPGLEMPGNMRGFKDFNVKRATTAPNAQC